MPEPTKIWKSFANMKSEANPPTPTSWWWHWCVSFGIGRPSLHSLTKTFVQPLVIDRYDLTSRAAFWTSASCQTPTQHPSLLWRRDRERERHPCGNVATKFADLGTTFKATRFRKAIWEAMDVKQDKHVVANTHAKKQGMHTHDSSHDLSSFTLIGCRPTVLSRAVLQIWCLS